ncbi:MAG: serine hydrolase domain-containing protein [Bacteroidota bacterium]
MKTIITITFILAGTVNSLYAQTADLEFKLNEYFDGIAQFGFSGTVIVGDKTSVIYSSPFGFADKKEERKNTSSTVFTTGSITKVFTALIILDLENKRLLSLDDPITKYVKNVPDDKKDITIRHLLSHTSGIKRNGLPGGDTNLDATKKAVLIDLLDSELLFEPGEKQEYSNIAYTLLAIIAENIEGSEYEDILYNRITKPAKMYQTGYHLPQYKNIDLAKGYRGNNEIPAVINLPQLEDGLTWNLRGNGGIHSNIFDMYRFFIALSNNQLIDQKMLHEMIQKPSVSVNENRYYGLGFEVLIEENKKDISHSGGNGYFASDFHWLIDEGKMFYIATNEGNLNIGQISENIKNIIRNLPYNEPPKLRELSDENLKKLEGWYRLTDRDSVQITAHTTYLSLSTQSIALIKKIYSGMSPSTEDVANKYAAESKRVLEQEFVGNFNPKYEAMNGSTSINNLKRYHSYDADYWLENFGLYKSVDVVAAKGTKEFTFVLLKINFESGAAAELFTWRKGVLSNISVIPDWTDFEFNIKLYPIWPTGFQSYNISNPLHTNAKLNLEEDESVIILGEMQLRRIENR